MFAWTLLLGASPFAWGSPGLQPLRIGLPHTIFHDQYRLLADWRQYLQSKLDRPVELVTRRKFGSTMDQLRLGELDFAWISDYPYVHLRRQVHLVAVPVYRGRPYFRSYLIVKASNVQANSVLQLRGMVFAYADPYSHGGYLWPRYELWRAGEDSRQFFRRTFFTWSLRGVVEAVAQGLADAGAVDDLMWDYLAKTRPDLTGKTRIIAQSQEYASPPFIANRSVSRDDRSTMQRVLVGMARDPEGRKLLKRLNLDGFIAGEESLYEPVVRMVHELGEE